MDVSWGLAGAVVDDEEVILEQAGGADLAHIARRVAALGVALSDGDGTSARGRSHALQPEGGGWQHDPSWTWSDAARACSVRAIPPPTRCEFAPIIDV